MEEKKLTANDAIYRMILAMNAGQTSDFYKVAELYRDTLSKSGGLYSKLSHTLRRKPMQFTRLDEMSNDIKKLVSTQVIEGVDIFLVPELQQLMDSLVLEWKNEEVFNYHNLGIRNKILFHGPTGNGKTTLARYISSIVNLPFVEVNGDMMVDSHIGSTGANIHKLFKAIQEPCILFWDEIDSIGYKRGSADGSAAGMENDRMVNSILVNMEKMHPSVIFIGATNRMESLDSAFMRRFHEVIEVKAPTEEEKIRYVEKLYNHYKIPLGSDSMVTMGELSSYSAIKKLFLSEAHKYVSSKITQPAELV